MLTEVDEIRVVILRTMNASIAFTKRRTITQNIFSNRTKLTNGSINATEPEARNKFDESSVYKSPSRH